MNLLGKNELLEKYEDERIKTDIYTRVMGYLRPYRLIERIDGKQIVGSSFNIGKQGEFRQRTWFETQKYMNLNSH